MPEDIAPGLPGEPARDFAAEVNRWFNEHVANSPISRSTDAINHLTQVAIPALIAKLEGKT